MKIKFRRSLVTGLAALGLGLLSQPLVAEPKEGPRSTIAVSGFNLNSKFVAAYGTTVRSGGLSTMLAAELQKTGKFVVVERPDLTDVLAEQELSAAQLVRRESAARAGQLLGAQILVHGEITEFSQEVSSDNTSIGIGGNTPGELGIGLAPNSRKGIVGIDIRLIDATSGELLSAFSVQQKIKTQSLGLKVLFKDVSVASQSFNDSPLGKASREAISKIVARVVAQAADTRWAGRVVDVEAGEVAINAGSKSGVSIGEVYQIQRIVKVLRDPATGRVLGSRKRTLGEITITEVQNEVAFGQLNPSSSQLPQYNDLVTFQE